MSYKVYAGAQDIVETLSDLKSLRQESLDEGQIVVVREVESDTRQSISNRLPVSGLLPDCVKKDNDPSTNAFVEVKVEPKVGGAANEFTIWTKQFGTSRKLLAYQILINTACNGCGIEYVDVNDGQAENIGTVLNTNDQIIGFSFAGNSITLSSTWDEFLDFQISQNSNCDYSTVDISDARFICKPSGLAGEEWPYGSTLPTITDWNNNYDLNGDGLIDINDVITITSNWQQPQAQGAAPISPNMSGEGTIENLVFIIDNILNGVWPSGTSANPAPQILASAAEGNGTSVEAPIDWNEGWPGGCAAMCHKTQIAYYWDPDATMHRLLSRMTCETPGAPWNMPGVLVELGFPAGPGFFENVHGTIYANMIVVPQELEDNLPTPYRDIPGRWVAFNYESWARLMWVEDQLLNSNVAGGVMSQNLIPSQTNTFDIGSAAYKIRDLYVDDNSIWIGDEIKLSSTGDTVKRKKRKENWVPIKIQAKLDSVVGAGKQHATADDKIRADYGSVYQGIGSATIELAPKDWLTIAKDLNVKGTGGIELHTANDLYQDEDFDDASGDLITDVIEAVICSIDKNAYDDAVSKGNTSVIKSTQEQFIASLLDMLINVQDRLDCKIGKKLT